ncbi:Uncharacterised protein [Salmonella enterica subsp. diarizonae]|uniref:Uncharacterized protein n=1 Tax=Salmonella diarizonae TaxID=59204 RepID=A0A379TY79_SALDZ|nr:Uncharacterised protein [Salmonella enterica subsp. diarizonae]
MVMSTSLSNALFRQSGDKRFDFISALSANKAERIGAEFMHISCTVR